MNKTKINWYKISNKLPPQNVIVHTKIDDGKEIRNEQNLQLRGKLWFHEDGKTYVYYQPTHWATKLTI